VIPGKQYTVEDLLNAAWRRRWVIAVPFVVLSSFTVVIAETLPNRYRSEALLQVMPQQVPENLVRPTVATRLDVRLPLLAQTILSRTQLERIVQDFNLYPKERQHQIMEDVIERMRSRDVLIGGRNGGRIEGDSFTIGFEAAEPRVAMQVAEKLAGLFIKENLQDRSVFAEQTDQFLQSQLDDTRRQLKEYELQLEEFRRANPGRMPGETATTQQALIAAQAQLQALQDSINRDRDRQMMLQQMMRDAAAAKERSAVVPVPEDNAHPSAAKQLEMARAILKNLETRLTPEHPDIKAQKRIVRELEQKAAAEALQQPLAPGAGSTETADATAAMQTELDMLDRRIAAKQEQEKDVMGSINGYRHQLEAVPAVETHLTELMRDYTTLQTTYQNLLSKSEEAKIASNLERRQIGEQFKIIDAAPLPQRPYSPDRTKIIVLGTVLALGVGFGLAGVLEFLDKSLRTEDDVVLALALPVLALVPTMITQTERQRLRRNRLLLATSGAAVFLCSVAVIAWKFQAIADWIR
jgi:polysaccharide chain length determinant protein (PEP-CTERM system associated)